MGRFCGILGPMCAKFGLKCLFFKPWGFPREAQDEVFKGAIFKILKCLQTILFITLEPCQRSRGPSLRTACGALSEGFFCGASKKFGVSDGLRGSFGGFFCGASKKFGVECECRRGLKAHLRGHGGPLGALRVNLDALMGHCMAQVLFFFEIFSSISALTSFAYENVGEKN